MHQNQDQPAQPDSWHADSAPRHHLSQTAACMWKLYCFCACCVNVGTGIAGVAVLHLKLWFWLSLKQLNTTKTYLCRPYVKVWGGCPLWLWLIFNTVCFFQVNPQLFSSREKEQMRELIDTMLAYNLSYRQDRTPEGQYTYMLEPWVRTHTHTHTLHITCGNVQSRPVFLGCWRSVRFSEWRLTD